MNKIELKELHEKFILFEKHMLGFKSEEYTAGDKDVLINFKELGAFMNEPPTGVCITFLLKHISSITKTVTRNPDTNLEWGISDGYEGIGQRILDARNYLLLLALLLEDNKLKTNEGDKINNEI